MSESRKESFCESVLTRLCGDVGEREAGMHSCTIRRVVGRLAKPSARCWIPPESSVPAETSLALACRRSVAQWIGSNVARSSVWQSYCCGRCRGIDRPVPTGFWTAGILVGRLEEEVRSAAFCRGRQDHRTENRIRCPRLAAFGRRDKVCQGTRQNRSVTLGEGLPPHSRWVRVPRGALLCRVCGSFAGGGPTVQYTHNDGKCGSIGTYRDFCSVLTDYGVEERPSSSERRAYSVRLLR